LYAAPGHDHGPGFDAAQPVEALLLGQLGEGLRGDGLGVVDEPIELDFNLETMSLIGGVDQSSWPDDPVSSSSNSSDPQLTAMQDMMERILGLLETQEARISALETGTEDSNSTAVKPTEEWARSLLDPDRIAPSMDEDLKGLNLPSQFDVQFYEGSARLTLTAQLQLNEVMEYMGMYPQLRVVCTGHADVTGDRATNLALSKRRAQAVRSHLLESGVTESRVVLNYFWGRTRIEPRCFGQTRRGVVLCQRLISLA
jgi:outer membrane protein OmpA-like peptidoglycan-associated protein